MSIQYQPKENLNIDSLLDLREYNEILEKIQSANVSDKQKQFLQLAATRFIRFNYAKIADYHSSTDSEMKSAIEKLHLVVVDKDNAILNGYMQYFEGFSKLVEECIGE